MVLIANQICVYEKDPQKATDIATDLGVNLKGISLNLPQLVMFYSWLLNHKI